MNEDRILGNARVVDLNTLDIVIFRVILIQHVACDVRDVLSGIGLSRQVDLPAGQVEGGHEVLPEARKVSAYVDLICDVGRCTFSSRRETRADRLVNVDHVGEIDKGERVGLWRVGTTLPQERSVFLEQAIERTTPWTAVQPDGDLVAGIRVVGWEEPEEQLVLVGAVPVDGECSGVGLADVEVDHGNACAIYGKFWTVCQYWRVSSLFKPDQHTFSLIVQIARLLPLVQSPPGWGRTTSVDLFGSTLVRVLKRDHTGDETRRRKNSIEMHFAGWRGITALWASSERNQNWNHMLATFFRPGLYV